MVSFATTKTSTRQRRQRSEDDNDIVTSVFLCWRARFFSYVIPHLLSVIENMRYISGLQFYSETIVIVIAMPETKYAYMYYIVPAADMDRISLCSGDRLVECFLQSYPSSRIDYCEYSIRIHWYLIHKHQRQKNSYRLLVRYNEELSYLL